MKKDKRTNNNLENTAQKPKYRATRTILKTGSESGFPGRVTVSYIYNHQIKPV
jgi:hypothetical protein